jgi:Uma2 family endonuclease
MTEPQKLAKLTVEEYLAFEESATVRHEYVDGQIFAMTGGSVAHNVIALNIATLLRTHLKGKGCSVFVSDIKASIKSLNRFYYPDVMVDCGIVDKRSVYTSTPSLIFEILSKSTAATDRREKLHAYQHIPSLKQYVIVHQSRKRLEVYRRVDEVWTVQELCSSDRLIIDSCKDIEIVVPVTEIYEDIDFDDGPDLMIREDVEVYTW